MIPRSTRTDASSELLSELRSLHCSGANVGEIDERRIRSVGEGINDSFKQARNIESNPFIDPAHPYAASAITYYRAKYLRQKRCLVAYLLWRLQKISLAWWQTTDNRITDVLHSSETEFLQALDDIFVDYMTSFPIPLDLRAFWWRPPSVQQLEVRGLKNHFLISPISGETVSIYAGKQILLRFEEAEPLIKQGVVELVLT